MKNVISVEHLSKQYDLGVIGTGTISRDLERWWARVRGKPDPYSRIGQKDSFERIGESILALDDVSFQVQQGEALGIIGRNGAGKSTLLKILSRVTAPTSGMVKVKGRIGSLLEVGTGFHPELTGRENVYLNGAILGMRKEDINRRFDEIVDFSGVEKFIDTPVKRYSSGMYVRLAFAVAAHLDPEILIVDEVLAVGDGEFQKKCLGKMSEVSSEGRTVLFVSHRLESISALCPISMLISDGKIVLKDETSVVISKYTDEKLSNPYETLIKDKSSVHFKQIKATDQSGNLKNSFRIGEPVVFSFEINNPYSQSLELGLSFWDKYNTRLWIFTNELYDCLPFQKGPVTKVSISFQIPSYIHGDVFVHAGIHITGQLSPHYVENIRDRIRFNITGDLTNNKDGKFAKHIVPANVRLLEE
ncbi:MAG: ATP-binding cassette domain-containing protein [Smithella sp.]|nr:ATP-binding cassette domain-containing protein [Smithella sp.]